MNIPQETLDAVLALLSGQGGGAVVVGILMATVKSFWKPENKQLYLIPAFILGYAASAVVMWALGWNWVLFAAGGFIVTSAQLLGENEIWPQLRALVMKLVFKKDE
jgi:hypothetical protein